MDFTGFLVFSCIFPCFPIGVIKLGRLGKTFKEVFKQGFWNVWLWAKHTISKIRFKQGLVITNSKTLFETHCRKEILLCCQRNKFYLFIFCRATLALTYSIFYFYYCSCPLQIFKECFKIEFQHKTKMPKQKILGYLPSKRDYFDKFTIFEGQKYLLPVTDTCWLQYVQVLVLHSNF